MKIDRNSWHWNMAKTGGDLEFARRIDLCAYCRAVLKGLFLYSLLTGGVIFLTYCVADFGAWVAAMIATKRFFEPDVPGMVVAMLLSVALAFIVIGVGYHTAKRKRVVPPLVREAYKGWKEKYFPVIDLTDA